MEPVHQRVNDRLIEPHRLHELPEPARKQDAPATERIAYGKGRKVCELANKRISESSGLASSRRSTGVFWTHNDSGHRAHIYAFGPAGEDLARFRLRATVSLDWEDMASFTRDGKDYLLIADVGDNRRIRRRYHLYVIEEPAVDTKKRGTRGKVKKVLSIRFKYSDGSHDCEAVAVGDEGRTVYLVTKTPGKLCKVYSLPLPRKSPLRALTAKTVATLRIPSTTAMDISPDGLRAVVLTYGDAYEYTRRPKEKWSSAFARAPRVIPMPRRRGGEAICYGPDGRTLYLTTEGVPAPLFEVPVVKPKKPTEKPPNAEPQETKKD
ncbi:MAG: hypothetical protein QGD94_00275 [Planctomycetia bacterium]|nr:hypothetical protein [Planctomycetia bacterium]